MDRGSSTTAVPSAAAAGARPVAPAAGRARLSPVGPARDDAFGRRGAAAQDCARAGSGGQCEAAGPQALHPGRAHHRPALGRRADLVPRADWIIDMGPGAGEAGGRVVAQGTPESIARVAGSATGRYLRDLG